jgi:HEAT repeat protein
VRRALGRWTLGAAAIAGAVACGLGASAVLPAEARAAATSETEALLDQVGGADTGRRYDAYRKLLDRRDPAIVAPLLERIGSWDVSAQSYGTSLLSNLGRDRAAPAWRKLLGAGSPYLRVCAAVELRDEDAERSSRVVVAALGDVAGNPAMAQWTLGRLSNFRDPAAQRIVRGWVRPECDHTTLAASLRYLAYAEDREAVPVVRDVAARGSAGARLLAWAWLVQAGDADAPVRLAELVRAGAISSPSDWYEVRSLIERIAPATVSEAILERAEVETDVSLLAGYVAFLSKARHAPALPLLRKLTDHASPVVANAAFEALSSMPGGLDGDTLRKQLASADEARALAAADALRRRDDLTGLPRVVEIVSRPGAQRWRAAEALGRFRTDAAVGPLLSAMLADDLSTRNYASNSLRTVLLALFPHRRIDLATVGWSDVADAATREAAVAKLRSWWESARTRAW